MNASCFLPKALAALMRQALKLLERKKSKPHCLTHRAKPSVLLAYTEASSINQVNKSQDGFLKAYKRILHIITFFIALFPSALYALVVDIVLPVKNQELLKLVDKIKNSESYSLNTYIKEPPEKSLRGDILVFISDQLINLSEQDYPAIIGLYVSEQVFTQKQKPNFTAIFSQQSLDLQLKLIQHISENKQTVIGYPYINSHYLEQLKKYEKDFPNFIFKYQSVSPKNPIREINQLIQECDFLLSSGESEIFNSATIRSLLLSSYRHKSWLIGPNESFVKAGSLATVYSNREDYAQEITLMLNKFITVKTLPKPRYPRNIRLLVNHSVSQSLGLNIPSEEALLEKLLEDTNED